MKADLRWRWSGQREGKRGASGGSDSGRWWLKRRSFFFSPLLRCAGFFLCFSFSLSTRFPPSLQWICGLPPVCSGSQWRGRGTAAAAAVFLLLGVCCLCQQRPPLSVVAVLLTAHSAGGNWGPGGAAWTVVLLPFSALSSISVLFLFSLSGFAGIGNIDSGRMTVLLWRWRGSTAVVRNGPSSPLCSDPQVFVLLFFPKVFPLCFVLLASVFFVPSLCSVLLPSLSLPFSLSLKFCPPWFFLFSTTQNTRPSFVYSRFFSPFFLPSSLYL